MGDLVRFTVQKEIHKALKSEGPWYFEIIICSTCFSIISNIRPIFKTVHKRKISEAVQLFLTTWDVRKLIYNLTMIRIVLINAVVFFFPSLSSNEMFDIGKFST